MRRKGVMVLALALVLVLGWGLALAQEKDAAEKTDETKKAAEEPAAKPKSGSPEGLWDLYVQSWPEGLVITALSLWMVAIILTNGLSLRRKDIIPPELVTETDELLRQKQAKGALELNQQSDSLLGKMMSAGISRVGRGFQQAVDYQAEVGQEEAMKLNHRLSYLSVIGSISPMLGLMGTVRGMIQAFAELKAAGGSPEVASLSEDIQLALVTTFEGLLVAVPALFAYSIFRNHLARCVTEADMVSSELMSRFQGVTAPLSRGTQPTAPPPTPPAPEPPQ